MKAKDTDYAYAVARIRANEVRLLNGRDVENLISCDSFSRAADYLASKGWTDGGKEKFSLKEAIEAQNRNLWQLLCESVADKDVLKVFTVQNDFYNIKAALKCIFTGADASEFFAYPTSIDLKLLSQMQKSRDFSALGEEFSKAAAEAYKVACQTESGQGADIILDRAALTYMIFEAKKSSCSMVREITDFICAAANIKIAVRCARTGKSESFAKSALAQCKAFDCRELAALCEKGEKAVIDYLLKTEYAKGVQLIEKNSAAFEKWCDDEVVNIAKKAKFVFFGFEPICAYYYAKQNEIKTVRIIMSAKESGLSNDVIRARVRELYV